MINKHFLYWLEALGAINGSDLYLTVGKKPIVREESGFKEIGDAPLTAADINSVISSLTNEKQLSEFYESRELNMALMLEDVGRFRINMFVQRQLPGLVVRLINNVPTLDQMGLPDIMGEMALLRRGLVIFTGATGSGKSTSMAAMVDHRNKNDVGHIISIEDPIEYIHDHNKCIITQREVGIDTDSYESALKNALRQRPDVIVIGEIRDSNTMDNAIKAADTGHLVLATLHASNTYQAMERIVQFFSRDHAKQVRHDMAANISAVFSQRLVDTIEGGKTVAIEVMLNQALITKYIRDGNFDEIKKVIAENTHMGMVTFDQALLSLWRQKKISNEVVFNEADNPTDVKICMKSEDLNNDGKPGGGLSSVDVSSLSFKEERVFRPVEPEPEPVERRKGLLGGFRKY
ncbi:MAG: PilT/PilU family type 4a pilus ATPase [Alphaproteobacteria bacterium]|nr:PilT/PilU family type 4a pilus ATPase [Alphaproteobacteria bacterium]